MVWPGAMCGGHSERGRRIEKLFPVWVVAGHRLSCFRQHAVDSTVTIHTQGDGDRERGEGNGRAAVDGAEQQPKALCDKLVVKRIMKIFHMFIPRPWFHQIILFLHTRSNKRLILIQVRVILFTLLAAKVEVLIARDVLAVVLLSKGMHRPCALRTFALEFPGCDSCQSLFMYPSAFFIKVYLMVIHVLCLRFIDIIKLVVGVYLWEAPHTHTKGRTHIFAAAVPCRIVRNVPSATITNEFRAGFGERWFVVGRDHPVQTARERKQPLTHIVLKQSQFICVTFTTTITTITPAATTTIFIFAITTTNTTPAPTATATSTATATACNPKTLEPKATTPAPTTTTMIKNTIATTA